MKKLETTPAKFSVYKARKAQACIAKKIVAQDNFSTRIKLVAGIDVAYVGDWAIGAATVLNYDTLEVLETQTTTQRTQVPYIPTLFAFRELPAAVAVIRKLQIKPDVFLVDGHGTAHPFGCGLASHLGVVLNMPTIGVAKSKLFGDLKQVGEDSFLIHNDKVIGAVVQTLKGVRPVYVSVGHLVSLATAVDIVKHCVRQSRIPEPIREAHMLASSKRKAKIASVQKQ